MKNKTFFLLLISFLIFINTSVFTQPFGQEPTERKRTYDVQHILLNIYDLDLKSKTLRATVQTSIVPLEDNFSSIEVDAVGMKIEDVERVQSTRADINNNIITGVTYEYDNAKLKINLDKSFNKGDTIVYLIAYTVTDPEKGLYFISPNETFPYKPFQVWSQGEGEDNRYWIPCYDYPNDMATSEMYVTVENQYRTLSNCVLESVKQNSNSTATWHWVSKKPYSSYLIMLGAGNWDVIEESWDGIPVSSYVPPGKKEWGVRSYRQTADILMFFSEYTGYRYPWGSYLQVAVEDYIYGGMENTGAVVYFDGSIYDDKTEPDYRATSLVAHEIAHQWWGDAVTCRNWNEIWLNESFATYFQCLYYEHLYGKDEFDYNIFRNGNDAIRVDSTTARKPIYNREGLTTNTYDKGSVVLNMMRYIAGDEKFRKTMNIYITKHQHTPVVTRDLLDALHEAMDSGVKENMPADTKWFFEEWIYKAGQPEIEVSYKFEESTKEISITARQIQRLDSSSVFKTPFPFQIITAKSRQDYRMQTGIEPKTYKIKLDSKPLCVIFNKGNKVLSKLYFAKPMQDWLYQLKNSEDAIDRISAIRGLKDFINNDSAVNAITEVMTGDKFWGVRYEAAQMLSNSTNKTVQDIYLKKLVEEKDSRVRRSYITGIAKLIEVNPELKENSSVIEFFLVNLINNENSYYAFADGISTLAKIMDKDKLYDVVVPYLEKDSHADIIRRHVMAALDSSNDPRTKDIFLEYGEKGSSSRLRNSAIRGLDIFLDDPKVIDFLNKKVLERPRSTQGVILDLLEKACNSSSKPFLEDLKAATNDARLKERVDKVLEKIIIRTY